MVAADRAAPLLRHARTGEILPPWTVDFGRTRRIDATAFVQYGADAAISIEPYLARLAPFEAEFAAWDGRLVVASDIRPVHRVVIVDRYGQVYEAIDADDPGDLPDAHALEEWFRFLATACPECGVLDDPRERSWTP